MVESGMEMEEQGNRGGKEVQIFGIRNNGEWGQEAQVEERVRKGAAVMREL